jgi:hypothetical protein
MMTSDAVALNRLTIYMTPDRLVLLPQVDGGIPIVLRFLEKLEL